MGWFNSTSENGALTAEEAYAGLLLGAVAADGEIAEEEVLGLVTGMMQMKRFASWRDRDFNRTFRKLLNELKQEGLDAFTARLVGALPKELWKTAFVNACELVLADGLVRHEEERHIDHLQRHLKLDDAFVKQTIEILTIKHPG